MPKLTDKCLMPIGKAHKGKAMANVPADYLLFLYKEGKMNHDVKVYIEENMEFLKGEKR